jgi:hypothetical protein
VRPLAVPVAAIALLVQAAGAAAQRPALGSVSAIRVANYNSPSVLLEGGDKAGAIVRELNALRRKAWRSGDTKLECYSTVIVYSGKKTVTTFRVRPDAVVEREGAKGVPAYSLAIDAGDIPRLSQLLAEIAPAKGCD